MSNTDQAVTAESAFGDIAEHIDETVSLRWDPADDHERDDHERNVLVEWNGGLVLLTLIDRSESDIGGYEVRVAQMRPAEVDGQEQTVLLPQGVVATELTRPALYHLGEGTAGMESPQRVKGHPAAHVVILEVGPQPVVILEVGPQPADDPDDDDD